MNMSIEWGSDASGRQFLDGIWAHPRAGHEIHQLCNLACVGVDVLRHLVELGADFYNKRDPPGCIAC